MLFDPAHISNIPQELRDIPRWICWRAVPSTDGTIGKIPKNPHHPTHNGSTTNPKCWGTFSEALGASMASMGELGIGFVFVDDDTIFGLDLDHCLDKDTLTPDAQEILRQVKHTYGEVSTSGTGVHVYGYGVLPKTLKTKLGELYATGRYFTVTGQHLPDSAQCLAECPPSLIDWLMNYLSKGATKPSVSLQPQHGTYQDIDINEEDDSPPAGTQFHQLCDKYPSFYAVWERKSTKEYASPSEEEMAIARYAYNAGWSPQDIYRLMKHWRTTHNLDGKHLTSYRLTIFNLHETPPQQAIVIDKMERAAALQVLAQTVPLPIDRVICLGSDDGHYRLVLTSGQQVDLGKFDAVEKQPLWRRLVAEQTSMYLAPIPGKAWNKVVEALIALKEVEENTDSNTTTETQQWLREFASNLLKSGLSYDIIRRNESFYQDTQLHVSISKFLAHVKVKYNPSMTQAGLAQRLRMIGWAQTSITLPDAAGKTLTQTYWKQEEEIA